MAIIITSHMAVNVAAAPAQVCPGMRIQAMDMLQPPGISMPGMDDMDPHQASVSAALPRNSSATVTRNPRAAGSVGIGAGLLISAPGVLVVALPPDAVFLVAAQRRAVQPLVHAPQSVEPARVGGVAVVHHTVAQYEGAHARAIAHEGRCIRAALGRELADDGR